MSQYIPAKFVAREAHMQTVRKQNGLKTGEYVKYPNAEAKDYFVIKASRLYAEDGSIKQTPAALSLLNRLERAVAMFALYRDEQAAKDKGQTSSSVVADNVAPETGTENE